MVFKETDKGINYSMLQIPTSVSSLASLQSARSLKWYLENKITRYSVEIAVPVIYIQKHVVNAINISCMNICIDLI